MRLPAREIASKDLETIMIYKKNIPDELMAEAVASIVERIENSGRFSELFVDTNILKQTVPIKNQIIYGRRGTGKTHLFGRLNEYYLENFETLKVIPVFIDGRNIACRSSLDEANSVISILISYRRFLDAIVTSIKNFINDTIVLSYFDKLWPIGSRNKKLRRSQELTEELVQLVRFGAVEFAYGHAESEIQQARSNDLSGQLAVDLKFKADIKELAENSASFGAGLKMAESCGSSKKLKIIYEGLTVIDYIKIQNCLEELIAILNAKSLVVLFDEWASITITNQPILAEMIRSTLVGGSRLGIKFACIPFYTRLSDSDDYGQTIGFPIGEEVFLDIDFDQICNPYLYLDDVMLFLLSILQKHLAAKVSDFKQASLEEWISYCTTEIFESQSEIKELVLASAGVPRDFLRIFSRAFRRAAGTLPIKKRDLRIAIHEFFTDEKRNSIDRRPSAKLLYELIFNKICLPTNNYIFFVSSEYANSNVLKELWNYRLIHLLFQNYMAYAKGLSGTYDIYIIDYGRYVSMRSNKKGESAYQSFEFLLSTLEILSSIPTNWLLQQFGADRALKYLFIREASATINPQFPDMEKILEDCSKYIVDQLISGSLP
jgi:hypothetical protein